MGKLVPTGLGGYGVGTLGCMGLGTLVLWALECSLP